MTLLEVQDPLHLLHQIYYQIFHHLHISVTFQMNGEAMVSEVKCLQEKCNSYKMFLAQKHESEHYLKRKIQDQQLEMEDVVLEAKRRVVSVRTFWRANI